ncbi:hypothetical protein GMDG_08359 [Pseudogymnoascus destructans 20631-21]|uniref:Aminoglycoside phosphotransferase domain-containing protein n=1 Tax=Pseudogymnoascus destructans (strain ATCC MYA-4855 / 20631-21) TaxID=658429 RepID=L8G3P9_PSED2|nr:hypothetical protein GMDG_08359 [Pseudogymnoascus destructans 20631-21]
MPIKEGYNAFYRLEYKDGSSTGMRIPCNGIVKFPKEKTRYEVAMMKYVAANTTIPVPKIYGRGTAEKNPTGLGPFIPLRPNGQHHPPALHPHLPPHRLPRPRLQRHHLGFRSPHNNEHEQPHRAHQHPPLHPPHPPILRPSRHAPHAADIPAQRR